MIFAIVAKGKLMIKIIATLTLCAVMSFFMLTGCAEEDIQHGRNENVKVIMELPNGEVIEGCPDWYWADTDSDKVRVLINGVEYRTSLGNVVFIEVSE